MVALSENPAGDGWPPLDQIPANEAIARPSGVPSLFAVPWIGDLPNPTDPASGARWPVSALGTCQHE